VLVSTNLKSHFLNFKRRILINSETLNDSCDPCFLKTNFSGSIILTHQIIIFRYLKDEEIYAVYVLINGPKSLKPRSFAIS
jgi:hypothetical protein